MKKALLFVMTIVILFFALETCLSSKNSKKYEVTFFDPTDFTVHDVVDTKPHAIGDDIYVSRKSYVPKYSVVDKAGDDARRVVILKSL